MEAISYLTKGLELLKTLPDTPERIQQELAFQMALGSSLMAAKSVGFEEVERTFARARILCQQVDETTELLPVLWGICWFYIGRGELEVARELAEQLLSLAPQEQSSVPYLLANSVMGITACWSGDFVRARTYLERGIALYDPQQHHIPAYITDRGLLRCWLMPVGK